MEDSMNTEMQGLLFFSSPVLLLSFIISIVQFAMSKRNRINLYLAVFTIKPALVTPLWALLLSAFTAIRFESYAAGPIFKTSNETTILVSALPAVCYTTIAGYCMRQTRKSHKIVFWLLLAVDAIRWMIPNAVLIVGMATLDKGVPRIDYVGIWMIACGITAICSLSTLAASIVFAFRKNVNRAMPS